MSGIIPGKHLGALGLLPAPGGTCEACAVAHPVEQPHNQQSLFYQYSFYNEVARWPTWADAMAHCKPEVQSYWAESLAKKGVAV